MKKQIKTLLKSRNPTHGDAILKLVDALEILTKVEKLEAEIDTIKKGR